MSQLKIKMTKEKQTKMKKETSQNRKESETICNDRDCPFHGKLRTRGRVFEGIVIKKFNRRVAIELERMIYIRKYERYAKSKTKIHARLPECMENLIDLGDTIKVKECRPLSKIIHFAVIEKVRDGEKQIKLMKKKK